MRTAEKIIKYSTANSGEMLECNGQAVSRVVYQNLFNQIGTTFGAGDGSTTFNVPDETPYPANCTIFIGV